MLIGYIIYGYDNDSYMRGSTDTLFDLKDLCKCPSCGYKTDFFYINPEFKLKKRIYDFSDTYDGYCIVSRKFKELCNRYQYSHINFINLPGDKDFFFFLPQRTIPFDSDKRKTRFENLCLTCKNYESVAGATPCFLKNIEKPIDNGFYRSDLLFGSGNEKSPLIIAGVETVKILKKERMKGLILHEINQ